MTQTRRGRFGVEAPRRRHEALALTGALGLHLIVLLAFLISPRGSMGVGGEFNRGTGAGDSGAAITVSLVRAGSPSRAAAGRSTATKAQPPPDPLRVLLKALDRPAPARSSDKVSPSSKASLDQLIAAADRRSKSASDAARTGENKSSQSASSGGTPGDLFPLVELCWRRAIDTSRTPILIKVVLDRRGMEVGGPEILEIGPGSREDQRVATERALQAIAACMPLKTSPPGKAGAFILRFGLSSAQSPR